MNPVKFAQVAGLAITLGLPIFFPAKAAEDCALKQIASLPLSPSNGRAIIVPASINGTELRFSLESSSNMSTLLTATANKLQLPLEELRGIEVYGPSGQLAVSKTRIHEFKIGQSVGHDFDMFLMKETGKETDYHDGTLGSNFLWQFDIEVDLFNNKVNLFNHNHCPGKVVYWSDAHFEDEFYLSTEKKIVLHTIINNTKMNAILNLGAATTSLNWIAANKLGITEESPDIEEIKDIKDSNAKKIKNYKYKLDSIEIGSEKLSKFPVYIYGTGITMRAATGSNIKEHDYDRDIEIGTDFLMFNRIFISYEEHKIHFTPYTGEQIKSLYARYGR
jgi:predicted aspartyl protease